MTLSETPADAVVRVVGLRLEPADLLRVREIGLCHGAVLRVWRRTPFGGRVIGLGGSRIAVDGDTAARVQVEDVAAEG